MDLNHHERIYLHGLVLLLIHIMVCGNLLRNCLRHPSIHSPDDILLIQEGMILFNPREKSTRYGTISFLITSGGRA
jgi:hypothetical protein